MQKWVVLLYMAGDNNLSQAGEEDIEELCMIGSSEQVTFAIEFDSAGINRDTLRYEISLPDSTGKAHPILREKLGETDSGNPECLSRFIEWGINSYPAENYFLIIWNHGGGFKYRMILDKLNIRREKQKYLLDNTRHNRPANRNCALLRNSMFFHPPIMHSAINLESDKPHIKNIAWDDITGNSLDMMELKKAILKGFRNSDIQKLKIVGFDACLMNMLEVIVQIKDLTQLVIGSEETEPFAGWPYHTLADFFQRSRKINLETIGKKMIKNYKEYYLAYPEENITMSAIYTRSIDELCLAFMEWIDSFVQLIPQHLELIFKIRQNVQSYTYTDYVDMGDLIRLTARMADNYELSISQKDELKLRTQAMLECYDRCVLASSYSGNLVKYSSGMSIWFPARKSVYQANKRNYCQLDFVRKYPAWNNCLNVLFKSMER